MFAIYNKVSRECLIMIFFMCMFFLLSFFSVFFPYYLPTTYLSLVITLLLLLLQLFSLLLPMQVFLRNQVVESSKQEIQASWSIPIHHIKWWIRRFGRACRTLAASEKLFVVLAVLAVVWCRKDYYYII